MSVSKNYQVGSATTFVIIGIILVAVFLGSIYFVVQRGEQVRKDAEASKIADAEAAKKAQEAANAAKAAAEANKPSPTSPSSTPQTPTTPLPETGIELDVAKVLAIGLLTATATSFVVSRRGLKRPL